MRAARSFATGTGVISFHERAGVFVMNSQTRSLSGSRWKPSSAQRTFACDKLSQ